MPFLACCFNGSLCFRTRPIYVHTYFIRRPAAEYATPKPYDQTLSPSESLACETMWKTYMRSITSYKYSIYSYTPVSRGFRTLIKYLFLYDLLESIRYTYLQYIVALASHPGVVEAVPGYIKLDCPLILHEYFRFWELPTYLQEEGEGVGGHVLVGLGVELGNLQGEREEEGEGEKQVLGMGVELQQLLRERRDL